MYVDDQTYKTKSGKIYRRVLLRTSFRKDGKVMHKTVGNLTGLPDEEIEAIKWALKNKDKVKELKIFQVSKGEQGRSVGAVAVLLKAAQDTGIIKALGTSRQGKQALWLIISRLLGASSRLDSVRYANLHAIREMTSMESFTEDDLYETLSWVSKKQERIEKSLFKSVQKRNESNGLKESSYYFYDLTSTYLEGKKNELAAYGYNRDKKKGKLQIEYGLLCDRDGEPISIQAYRGNKSDHKTVRDQIDKLKERFGCKYITFVGDKGMIKGEAIDQIEGAEFHFITGITKAQIRRLLSEEVLQLELFDSEVGEVEDPESGYRYVFRVNPYRREEIRRGRLKKLEYLKEQLRRSNEYLKEHRRAKLMTQKKKLEILIKKFKFESFLSIEESEANRSLKLVEDTEELKKLSELDGCYVLKTNLPKEVADRKEIHSRYKELSKLEGAFRIQKSELDVRPVNVRLEDRTRGHLFLVMLSYKLHRYLANKWSSFNISVSQGLEHLKLLSSERVVIGTRKFLRVFRPDKKMSLLIKSVEAVIPSILPGEYSDVYTRKNPIQIK